MSFTLLNSTGNVCIVGDPVMNTRIHALEALDRVSKSIAIFEMLAICSLGVYSNNACLSFCIVRLAELYKIRHSMTVYYDANYSSLELIIVPIQPSVIFSIAANFC